MLISGNIRARGYKTGSHNDEISCPANRLSFSHRDNPNRRPSPQIASRRGSDEAQHIDKDRPALGRIWNNEHAKRQKKRSFRRYGQRTYRRSAVWETESLSTDRRTGQPRLPSPCGRETRSGVATAVVAPQPGVTLVSAQSNPPLRIFRTHALPTNSGRRARRIRAKSSAYR